MGGVGRRTPYPRGAPWPLLDTAYGERGDGMRIGTDGDMSRRIDLEAWAAQIAAMHLSVSRMSADARSTPQQDDRGVPTIGPAESLRAQVLSSRQNQMSVQDGLGYVQVAGADLQRSQEVLGRIRVVAAQATDDTVDPTMRAALQKYVDRSVQELEGIAEQARYHTLKMLGGTASTWSLPEAAPPQSAAAAPLVAATAPTDLGRPTQAGPAAMAPEPGVSPVVPASPLAVPPTTRPDQAFGAGTQRRGLGVFAEAAGPQEADPTGADRSARPERPTGAFASRAPIGTAADAHSLMRRVDLAGDVLAQVGAAVDAAEQSLLRTIGELGLDQVRLPGDSPSATTQSASARTVERDGAMRQLTVQSAAQSSAAVLVEATRAQFDAVTTVLGGTAAAAAVGAQTAFLPRDTSMAPRPAVEAVATTNRTARAESGRERSDRGGGGVAHR